MVAVGLPKNRESTCLVKKEHVIFFRKYLYVPLKYFLTFVSFLTQCISGNGKLAFDQVFFFCSTLK